jgi:hypothetical protein
MKQVTAEVVPFLTSLHNHSLSTGVFPEQDGVHNAERQEADAGCY